MKSRTSFEDYLLQALLQAGANVAGLETLAPCAKTRIGLWSSYKALDDGDGAWLELRLKSSLLESRNCSKCDDNFESYDDDCYGDLCAGND